MLHRIVYHVRNKNVENDSSWASARQLSIVYPLSGFWDNVLIRLTPCRFSNIDTIDGCCCSDVKLIANVSKLGNLVEMTPTSFLYKMEATTLLFSLCLPNVYFCSPRFTSTASTFSRHPDCSSTVSLPSSSHGFSSQNQSWIARPPSRPSSTHSNRPACALLWSFNKCS
jgi:hypothetical protein